MKRFFLAVLATYVIALSARGQDRYPLPPVEALPLPSAGGAWSANPVLAPLWTVPIRLPPVAAENAYPRYVPSLPAFAVNMEPGPTAPAEKPADSPEKSDDPKLGSPPTDTRLQFLRQATVLLKPGEYQFDYGLDYVWGEFLLPALLADGSVAAAHVRRRSLIVPLAVRYGLTDRCQAFLNAPVGWAHAEFADRELDANDQQGGCGDVNFGLTTVLWQGTKSSDPEIMATLTCITPTGGNAFGPLLASAALGEGFWSAAVDLLAVYTFDPAVVFFGFGYRHRFADTFFGQSIQLGEEFTYRLGLGFAINDKLTLSTAVAGSFFTETEVNGHGVPGSMREPITARLALTVLTEKRRYIEPFVRIGLTSDASAAELGVVITRY